MDKRTPAPNVTARTRRRPGRPPPAATGSLLACGHQDPQVLESVGVATAPRRARGREANPEPAGGAERPGGCSDRVDPPSTAVGAPVMVDQRLACAVRVASPSVRCGDEQVREMVALVGAEADQLGRTSSAAGGGS